MKWGKARAGREDRGVGDEAGRAKGEYHIIAAQGEAKRRGERKF